jgi:hypothetical protein
VSFSASGTIIHSTTSTFSLTPGTIGDFIWIEVFNWSNTTVFATALSSSNVTWATLGTSFTGTSIASTSQMFLGKVTATSAQTVTITWSGATPGNILAAGQEFSSTLGAASVTLDVQVNMDSAGTASWSSLTPGHGAGELYIGYVLDHTAAVSGSTSGYVYQIEPSNNGMAYNLSCPNAATFPVWADAHEGTGIIALLYEAGAAAAVTRLELPVKAKLPGQHDQALYRPGLIYVN